MSKLYKTYPAISSKMSSASLVMAAKSCDLYVKDPCRSLKDSFTVFVDSVNIPFQNGSRRLISMGSKCANEGLSASCEAWHKYRTFLPRSFLWRIIDMKSSSKWWGDSRYCFDKNTTIFWDVCKHFKSVPVLSTIRLVWISGLFFSSWYNKLVARERSFWLTLTTTWFSDWSSGGTEKEDFLSTLFVFILYESYTSFFLISDILLKSNRATWKSIQKVNRNSKMLNRKERNNSFKIKSHLWCCVRAVLWPFICFNPGCNIFNKTWNQFTILVSSKVYKPVLTIKAWNRGNVLDTHRNQK